MTSIDLSAIAATATASVIALTSAMLVFSVATVPVATSVIA
jgi:hypothetical protein